MGFSENGNKFMADKSDDVDESSEKVSEAFICCICLDLLFKPIVLACGHVSCFWCVHKSMSGLRESHCPICRYPYHHFPTVCWMLHFLLIKMYPIAYKRREIQILEYEKEKGSFSPQLDGPLHVSQTEQELYHLDNSQVSPVYKYDSSSDPSSSGKDDILLNVDQLEFASTAEENGRLNLQQPVHGLAANEGKKLQKRIATVTCQQISVDDALCTLCRKLLFHPIVLNCGHVYCESCISVPTNATLNCQVCQSVHPGQAPKIFLELNDFLEKQFPVEYAQRGSSVQRKHSEQESSTTCSSEAAEESFHLSPPSGENVFSWWGDHKVHIGAGCDCCGMYPIIGDRYRCKDCVEAIGYDLCGDCYSTGSKLPGRFNQQHTPEHKFEVMRPNSIRNIMLRLLRGQLDVSAAPNPSSEASENPESLVPSLSGDVQENAESGFVADSETEEDESNHP